MEIFHQCLSIIAILKTLEEVETERLYGSTHHRAKMWKKNIGKLFIKLVRKHFRKNNKYHENLNLNTLRVSYCCPINVRNIIKQHNSNVLSKKKKNTNNRKCNCKSKPNCPLNAEHHSMSSTQSYMYNIKYRLFWY